MRKALLLTLALPLLALPTPAQANDGVIDLTNYLVGDGWTNSHAIDLVYTCGVDGTVTFSGTGASNGVSEAVSGTLDTTNRTFIYTGAYASGYSYTITGPSGSLVGDARTGTIDYTGTGTSSSNETFSATGQFLNVPDCPITAVVGNHGEYVSGAVKAGVKGTALAAIAKDKTKVGAYPS